MKPCKKFCLRAALPLLAAFLLSTFSTSSILATDSEFSGLGFKVADLSSASKSRNISPILLMLLEGEEINHPPVATAGADRIVAIGSLVTLDGSGSTDADDDPLTYKWTMISKPPDSTTTLSDSTTVNPTFIPDVDGTYEISLVVNDGKEDSDPDTVTITASEDFLEKVVVGAYYGTANCGVSVAVGFFFCPSGRLRGFEKIAGTDYVNCGTWYVDQNNHVQTVYTATDTKIGEDWDGIFTDFLVLPDYDHLVWNSGCLLILSRLEGAVDDADCTTGWCTSGGTGDIQCSADFDCGRCWYCDDGTCRYGGEGPYGCYRGWEPP